jgi:hypothetical protein
VGEVTTEPPEWWSVNVLSRVWAQLAERLERNGLQARGTIVVNELGRGERHALGGLLGRVLVSDVCTVDRPAQRQAKGEWREAPFAAARVWLEQHPALDQHWTEAWLAALRRDGVLMRDSDPSGLMLRALSVLAACLDDPKRPTFSDVELLVPLRLSRS